MRSAWIEINLDAYRNNLRALSAHAGCPVLAVVKANAYGHGLAPIARAAREAGCPGVGVALPEEGAELRAAGQDGRIVVLSLALEEQAELIAEHALEPVVTREEVLQALSEAAGRLGQTVGVHLKVDTGMTRVGVEPEVALDMCERIRRDPHLTLAGLLTHFASADDADLEFTHAQWERFAPLAAAARQWSPRPVLHSANSPAALWFPAGRLDWVRGGIMTYGVPPAPHPTECKVAPVLSLKARLVQVKEVPAGRRVSYAGRWTSPRRSVLALAPLGYADGIPWSLSDRGYALVRGQRAPIRGRVCMDQLVLDVTDIPGVVPGEEAVFIGRQGAEEITAVEVAEAAGTISYEILTRLAARLPRLYGGATL
jgi:alanine racemase